jgi:hypothetical protein
MMKQIKTKQASTGIFPNGPQVGPLVTAEEVATINVPQHQSMGRRAATILDKAALAFPGRFLPFQVLVGAVMLTHRGIRPGRLFNTARSSIVGGARKLLPRHHGRHLIVLHSVGIRASQDYPEAIQVELTMVRALVARNISKLAREGAVLVRGTPTFVLPADGPRRLASLVRKVRANALAVGYNIPTDDDLVLQRLSDMARPYV